MVLSNKVRIKKLPKLTKDGKPTGKWRYILTATGRAISRQRHEFTSQAAAQLMENGLRTSASQDHMARHPNDKRHVQIAQRKARRAAGIAVSGA